MKAHQCQLNHFYVLIVKISIIHFLHPHNIVTINMLNGKHQYLKLAFVESKSVWCDPTDKLNAGSD